MSATVDPDRLEALNLHAYLERKVWLWCHEVGHDP